MSKSASPWVVNTSQASFAIDVIERSKQTPVVVDFWAEWYQPCRMLGPLLESLADEYGGRFVLVKAETDQVPDAMAQFNVELAGHWWPWMLPRGPISALTSV